MLITETTNRKSRIFVLWGDRVTPEGVVMEEQIMTNFNYASTSEEFSTMAEDRNEQVREVAQAQEESENKQETKDKGDNPSTPQDPNENWEAVNEPE